MLPVNMTSKNPTLIIWEEVHCFFLYIKYFIPLPAILAFTMLHHFLLLSLFSFKVCIRKFRFVLRSYKDQIKVLQQAVSFP